MSSSKTARMPKTGFPVASKVLMKYDKQRAYKQHQQKMQDMRHGLDNSSPQQYPHLVVRMKRLQKEEERQMLIDHENELLVNKMRKIMTRKGRLDNWNDYNQRSLNMPYRERRQEQIAVDNLGIAKRLESVGPVYHVKSWEDDFHRHEEILERRAEETKDFDDGLTPRRQKRLSKTRQQRKAQKGGEAAVEDKYEDDFESDTESAEVRDRENGDGESQSGRDKTRARPENDQEEGEKNSKLPKIESKRKDSTKENNKGSSKVSKLPAVSQTKKDSVEEKFAVYRDKKFEAKLKTKTQQKKSQISRKSSSVAGSKSKSVSEDAESTTGSAQRESRASESSANREGNHWVERVPQEDPETGEQREVHVTEGVQPDSQPVHPGQNSPGEPHHTASEAADTREHAGDPENGAEGENEDKSTDLTSAKRGESAEDRRMGSSRERVKSAGNISTATSQSGERKSAKGSVRSLQSVQSNRTEDASSNQSEGGTTLAESDAKQLFRVSKELEPPEDIFIKTLIRRSYQQRMQTKSKFRDLYDLDLVSELRQGLGEPWYALISALLTEKEASDVSTVHTALENKDVSSMVELFCTRNVNSLNTLKEAYRKEYAISLESDISEKTDDPVQLLLLTLLKAGRMEASDVNEEEAEKDARELFESGEGRWTSDTGKFIRLVQQKNTAQFKATLNVFKQISGGKDVLVSIRQDCESQEYIQALSTLINCSKGPQVYFSEKLHGCQSLEDLSFVSVLVSRAETDMPGTRKVYKKKYGQELGEDLASRGPHVTLRVLQELVNRPAPGQSKTKTQGSRKPAGNQQVSQPKKPVVRKPERKDEAAAAKHNPLNQPGKRVLAEAKHKLEHEEKAKTKQLAPKQTKGEKESEPGGTVHPEKKDTGSETKGTVYPAKNFNADKDADILFKAMDGLGTNEDEIVNILPHRSNSQRQQIKAVYNKKYNRSLLEDLKSELSGDFEEVILALLMEPVEYDAYCLNDAVRGLGTDEAALVGILSTRTPQEIKAVKEQYQKAYKTDLAKDVAGDTSNAFKQILLKLVQAERNQGTSVDENKAQEDAKKLFKEDTKSLCVTDGTLQDLLTQENRAQIKATFDKYREIAGHDVYEGIKLAMLGDDEDGYVGLAKACDDVVEFYASRLNQSMTRDVGTDEKMVIRVIVSRSEIDLKTIKEKYQQLYGRSLAESVESECSGDFRKTLLIVLGEKQLGTRSTSKDDGEDPLPESDIPKAGHTIVQGEGVTSENVNNGDDKNNSKGESAQKEEDDQVFQEQNPPTPPDSEIGLEKQRRTLPSDSNNDQEWGENEQSTPKEVTAETGVNEEASQIRKSELKTTVPNGDITVFEPGRDCEFLFSLLNEKDVDENKIFNLLIHRSHRQRLQLRMKYQILYRQDLVRELRNSLSPSLEIVLGALTLEMVEYDALCIHQAVSGIAIDDRTLVNILISRDPVHLKAVKIKFWQVYGKDLIDYLRRVTNSELGELLLVLSCLREGKSPSRDNEELVTESAQRLVKKLSSGEKSYLDVFHKKSGDDIHKVFRKYSEITGKDVSESFQKYKSGEVKTALMAFADYLNDHTLFYVHQLREAMADPGVDGIILIHIIVSRSEVDLGEIKARYLSEYGLTLEEDVERHCRAKYSQVLLALLRAAN